MYSYCCGGRLLSNDQCEVCGADGSTEMWAALELQKIMHGVADEIPGVVGNSDVKIEVLQLLDRARGIVAQL